MASQHGSRFASSPIFNQNFSMNNFNVNPSIDRPPAPQFQRHPNQPNGRFQSPEEFIHGFQSRPQFSNFPSVCDSLNRSHLPPPSAVHSHRLPPPNPVPGPSNSFPQSSFPGPLNPSHSPFSGPSNSAHSFPSSSNPPQHPFPGPSDHAQRPFPGPSNPSQPPFPGPSNLSHPPFPGPSHPPFPGPPNSRVHFSGSSNSANLPFCGPPNSAHNRFLGPSTSFHHPLPSQSPNPSFTSPPPQLPPPSHHSPTSLSHPQRPFSPRQSPPQHNQHRNMSQPHQQNQFPSMPHSPHQHQRFPLNSQTPATGSRFDNSLKRPYKHWHQMTRFSGPRTPFFNRSPNIVKSQQFKDGSQLVGKKKKEKSREFKKLKEDSTDKPYSCDTCDRAFITENELNEHFSLHVTCEYENCNFKAHPKIVMLHKKMQHETGFAERISKLKNDADVKKWREERRKRFPTAENIRKRKAEQAEREARGEVLETKDFGKFKRRKEETKDLTSDLRQRTRGHRVRRKKSRRNFHEYHPGYERRQFKVNAESDSDSDSHISLNMFSGLSSLSNSPEEMSHADEIVEPDFSEQNLPKAAKNINKNYSNESHSENNSVSRETESPALNSEKLRDNERPAEESILEIPENEIEKPKRELIVLEDSDDEGPEIIGITKSQDAICVDGKEREIRPDVNSTAKVSDFYHEDAGKKEKIRSDVSSNASQVSDVNHKDAGRVCHSRRENNFFADDYAAKEVRKNSLLEKLLADDIRHERNVILQCIRHIVNNNFFGLAVKKT